MKETIVQFTGLEVFFIVTTVVSLFFNFYQLLIWRRDQRNLFRPVSNALIALFNDIKLKSTNVYLAQQVLFSQNNPHSDVATLRWEYAAFTQNVLAYMQGFQEAVVGILASTNPDDKDGSRAFRASDFGLTEEERDLRQRNLQRIAQMSAPVAPSPQAQASANPRPGT